MARSTTSSSPSATPSFPSPDLAACYADIHKSFERFCLTAGIDALAQMLDEDVTDLAGERSGHNADKPGYRWGTTPTQVGLHGGTVALQRPRVRSKASGEEMTLPSWAALQDRTLLGISVVNAMLCGVATRKSGRVVRPAEAQLPSGPGHGLAKSTVSRRYKALTEARFQAWMGADLSDLDLVAIQIDGLHRHDGLLMIGAVGIDVEGHKHPLGLIEGATENAATVQALVDDLIKRGLDPATPHLFIVDGAKALSAVLRRTFGADVPIQRCQIHKARNIIDRLPDHLQAAVRAALRQAWALDDPAQAERQLRALARRFDNEAPAVARAILEGLDETLTLVRLGLPADRRQSLASTNIIESMHSVVRQTCRNVKRWRNARMGLRWTAAGRLEAQKGFRRLNACQQLPLLREALMHHQRRRHLDTLQDAA